MFRWWVRKHSLSLVLVVVLLVMMTTTVVMGPAQHTAEGVQGAFWPWWTFQTILSFEADVFGAVVLVTFTKWFYESRSAEAKDPPDEHAQDHA